MGNGVNWSEIWNNGVNFGFGGGMGMPFGGGFGGMGSAWGDGFNYGAVGDSWGGSSSSSSSSKLSYEEKKAKNLETQKRNREFNALKGLLDDLAKDESILSFAEREDLKYDVTHLQGKNKEEKFESLKAIYNKYKDTIRNNLGKLGEMSKDFAGIGYESNSELADKMPDLASSIANESEEGLAGFKDSESIKTLGVLNILSTWNSSSSVNGKNLMETILEKYNAIDPSSAEGSTGAAKRTDLENFAKNLKSQLATKAGELANNAMLKDDTLKDQLKKLKGNLDGLQFQYCAETFNELYKACRIAGAKIIENTYKEKYEFLGSDNLFGNVIANTIEDLKSEGFGETVNIDNLKDAKMAKKEALKEHADISILESCGKCKTRTVDAVAWVDKTDKTSSHKKSTDCTLKELCDNDAIMSIYYSPDDDDGRWDEDGKNYVKYNLGEILDGINQTLSAAGLDSERLTKAKEKVLSAYINKGCSSLQDDKSDMKRKSDYKYEQERYALVHIAANLDGEGSRGMKASYDDIRDTRHKIIDIHDDDGFNTHLFIVRVKDLVEDILKEYNNTQS